MTLRDGMPKLAESIPMSSKPSTGPVVPPSDRDFERQLREMNEALLVSSVRMHALAEQAQKTERELAKALVFADDIIATLREPFLVLDHEMRVKTANRAFYNSFHVTQEETENRYVFELGNRQWDIPGLRALLEKVLSRNQSIHDYELEHDFPVLGRKTMVLNARPFPPESEHPELILLAVEDVSNERRRADELADDSRRKDEFLAMLSHELRNPLAPISNALQLLAMQKDQSSLQQQARTILERQVGQLTRLVEDLLEVSRITTNRIHLQLERARLDGILERATEAVLPLMKQCRHELTVTHMPQPIWLNADPARLEQVLVNLLTNAAKYTPHGGQISLIVQQEGQDVLVRVRDTGLGIASDLLPHIFDLFTQATQSLDRSIGGLGIGLALVKRLVEMHGGRVEVTSKPGSGSEFVVRLPVITTSAPPSSPSPETRPWIGPPLRLLVVDDNVDAAQTLGMLLEALGHEVRTANDGLTALEVAFEYRPQVVLLDIGLPGIDGYQVAKRLREHSDFQDVLLVAMTGYGQEADKRHSQQAGFNQHLIKPVDIRTVQQILTTRLQKTT